MNKFEKVPLGKFVAETIYLAYQQKSMLGSLADRPLQERIKEAIAHAEQHNQMNDALWPFLPFSLTVGEVLRAALKGQS